MSADAFLPLDLVEKRERFRALHDPEASPMLNPACDSRTWKKDRDTAADSEALAADLARAEGLEGR